MVKYNGSTTDNGGNIVNAYVEYLKPAHIHCIGHTLQLAVTDELVKVLTPFNLATEIMSGEKYLTINMMIPSSALIIKCKLKNK